MGKAGGISKICCFNYCRRVEAGLVLHATSELGKDPEAMGAILAAASSKVSPTPSHGVPMPSDGDYALTPTQARRVQAQHFRSSLSSQHHHGAGCAAAPGVAVSQCASSCRRRPPTSHCNETHSVQHGHRAWTCACRPV